MATKNKDNSPKKESKTKKTVKKADETTKKATKPTKKESVKRVSKTAKSGTNSAKPVPEKPKSGTGQPENISSADEAATATTEKKTTKRNAKGQIEKGSAKVPNSGRKPGSKNKYGNVRDRLKNILLPYLNDDPDAEGIMGRTLATDLQRIGDPKDRVDAVAKLMPFVVPKYSSTTISADSERPIAEEDRLLELDGNYKKQTEISIKSLTIVDNDNGGEAAHLSQEELDKFADDDDE